jgi:hypothetical protein
VSDVLLLLTALGSRATRTPRERGKEKRRGVDWGVLNAGQRSRKGARKAQVRGKKRGVESGKAREDGT